ncbi:DNA methyltransferase, partial [Candidatus Dojkabacteria bacterium CG_4_10_14_0_2_um_filter_Dojkabacteria_WS6_41_15]
PALEALVESINPSINAVNDPKQQKVGAPDFVLLKGKTPIGYIEAKDVDIDLEKEFKTKNQFNRYKASLNNLCFTNYLDFHFYLDGQAIQKVAIARLIDNTIELIPDNIPLLESILKNFTTQKSISIRSPKELASLMAEKAKMLKNVVYLSLKDESEEKGQVEQQYEVFKQMLIHDLSLEQYADIYAQTVAYGMFAARYHDNSLNTFTRDEANSLLPKSNPFLRNFFQTIAGYNIDKRIVWIVDDLAELFNHVDVRELLANYGKETKRHDAIIHFYETFLGEYDQKMRKSRGVYYTPEPVVDFIVRAVDDILKTEFGITDGLADTCKIEVEKEVQGSKKKQKAMEHRVQVLDPATGTGTFLDHVIKHIYNSKFKGQQGIWQGYVDEHLLPRIHGFEILMASYSMAHLKLDITLAETGYDSSKGQGKRLGVYLTNTLEEPEAHQRDLFSQWLTTESMEANEVKKEKPIMVVMGNPPYSISSSNKGEWIQNLIKDYKKDLKEKKLNLDDDYIKFIRYAQWFIEKNGEGIIAYISNNSFIDGITHRQMRKSLLETFNKIYILDLHGNAKKKEVSPDGSKDENVFDIMQGVSINIFVKNRSSKHKLGEVYHSELWGKREKKYEALQSNVNKLKWKKLDYLEPEYFFVHKNLELAGENNANFSIQDLFRLYSSGLKTERDSICIQSSISDIKNVVNDFYKLDEISLKNKYSTYDTRDWKLKNAVNDVRRNIHSDLYKEVLYRPFDKRWTWYSGNSKGFIGTPGKKINSHMIYDNYSIITKRGQDFNSPPCHITNEIADIRVYSCPGVQGSDYMFPLYLYSENQLDSSTRKPNLDEKIIAEIAQKLKLQFIPDHEHADSGKEGTFNPLDVLDYVYAILHSPTYRERYKEFLKFDFPRIPFTSDQKLFWSLVEKGRVIRQNHLMEHPNSSSLITQYPVAGENEVINLKYSENKVWINDTQYFDNVPQIAWDLYIGGYQPTQKWLKDRKGKKLTFDEVLHYQRIIVALVNTDRIMKEIDGLLPKWPLN